MKIQKSVKLTTDEKKRLKSFVRKQNSATAAAEMIGISHAVLYNVQMKGCGRADTIQTIRNYFTPELINE